MRCWPYNPTYAPLQPATNLPGHRPWNIVKKQLWKPYSMNFFTRRRDVPYLIVVFRSSNVQVIPIVILTSHYRLEQNIKKLLNLIFQQVVSYIFRAFSIAGMLVPQNHPGFLGQLHSGLQDIYFTFQPKMWNSSGCFVTIWDCFRCILYNL